MEMNKECLPCLVNQIVKITQITHLQNSEQLFKKVFAYMSQMDFHQSNPEIIGHVFSMIKDHIGNDDPYKDIRNYYNDLFLSQIDELDEKILSFDDAVKYAIVGNVIDFSPMHQNVHQDISTYFKDIDHIELTINHIESLKKDIIQGKQLLYIGDNCGEICLDILLMKRIKHLNPHIHIYFATRGYPVVNDNIESDAYKVGIHQYATIIHNGDCSLGTVLHRTSQEFQKIYDSSDVVIAKGQANFESLSEEMKNIYFMLMVKCQVISRYVGAKEKSFVCMKNKTLL